LMLHKGIIICLICFQIIVRLQYSNSLNI